jgi:broad specificity phosphatase PhoE
VPARPVVYVVRHGATDWSETGRHTGRTDLPLNERGQAEGRAVAPLLAHREFALVLTSPLQRARDTARLAGYGEIAEPCADLLEWDYGTYEGITTAEIREHAPGWTVWSGDIPDGETIDEVSARADRVIERIIGIDGDVALFAHGHILRVVTARWCELNAREGRRFPLATASLCILGWEHDDRGVQLWNARPPAASVA